MKGGTLSKSYPDFWKIWVKAFTMELSRKEFNLLDKLQFYIQMLRALQDYLLKGDKYKGLKPNTAPLDVRYSKGLRGNDLKARFIGDKDNICPVKLIMQDPEFQKNTTLKARIKEFIMLYEIGRTHKRRLSLGLKAKPTILP